MNDYAVLKKVANNVRTLAADAIQKANSGHPGMPLGCADFATVLFAKHLNFNPCNHQWLNRDRFVLSAGHGSMLGYALWHLFEFGLTLDELKQFRQFESRTPGHPEYGQTPGVDITTGPLGSGFASAVGMAIAQKQFIARADLTGSGLIDHKIYIIAGDGCMMEGAVAEAASLAGHLKLEQLICFYDDNRITIEGDTDLAFSENVALRFEACNWRVIHVEDANDIGQCDAALNEAADSDGRPTLIIGRTTIAHGAPNKAGKNSSHGEPLGVDEVKALKAGLQVSEEEFYVSEEVRTFCQKRAADSLANAASWDKQFQAFLQAEPAKAELIHQLLTKPLPSELNHELLDAVTVDKAVASRVSGGEALQRAAELIPALTGGSADLAPSTKTVVKNGGDFSVANPAGRNIHFGVRELAMGLAANGMALYGTALPFVSTFFVFSDYMKPAIRLAALQKLPVLFIFTHDSFHVGEDGPTHEPIEQLAMLRATPDLTVFRPADARETACAMATALRLNAPAVMVLTRQNLPLLDLKSPAEIEASRGAYIVEDMEDFDLILVASGSEVKLATDAAIILRQAGFKLRVVSMLSMELFAKASPEYREAVLPSAVKNRVAIEAGSSFGWHRWVGSEGLCLTLDHFGASAPSSVLAQEFGFTATQIAQKVAERFQDASCQNSCHCQGGCCSK